jgi:putative endonuclease
MTGWGVRSGGAASAMISSEGRPAWQRNRSKTLYIGVTNDLERRMGEHRNRVGSKFAAKYNITRLVYYETFGDIRDAIAREKQLKGWRRDKKIDLIEEDNPLWEDLSQDWFD